jgi:hypothetical protein
VFQKTDYQVSRQSRDTIMQFSSLCRLANDRGGVIDDGPKWVT